MGLTLRILIGRRFSQAMAHALFINKINGGLHIVQTIIPSVGTFVKGRSRSFTDSSKT